MPTLLVARHRPGFYLRVLEEGLVQAGDEIEKVADGPERLTVADVDALLYLPNKSRSLLERVLRVPALSEGWQGSFRELLAKADGDAPTAPAWSGFQPLRVAEIRRQSLTITSFLLAPTEDAAATPVASPGQYLTLRLRPGVDDQQLTRSYSLSDVADERGYRISVKLEGAGSRYLHERVNVGDLLEAAAPRGNFVLRDGTGPVVLISAGAGATPVLAMLHALAREHSTRSVWWLHGARNHDEHAFGAEVDELLAALPGSHRLVAYSKPVGMDATGRDYDLSGRLDLTVLEDAGVPMDADYYLCWPDGFMRTIGSALAARGVTPERIATEVFGAVPVYRSGIVKHGDRAPHAPDGPIGSGPVVTFSRSDLAVPWDDRYPSLLDFAEACDVPVGFGCRNGTCHNCESGLLTRRGQLPHRPARTTTGRSNPRVQQPAQLRADARPLTTSRDAAKGERSRIRALNDLAITIEATHQYRAGSNAGVTDREGLVLLIADLALASFGSFGRGTAGAPALPQRRAHALAPAWGSERGTRRAPRTAGKGGRMRETYCLTIGGQTLLCGDRRARGEEWGSTAGRAPDVVSNQRGRPRLPVPRLHGKPDARCVQARGRLRLNVENGVAAPTRVHTIPKGAWIIVISTRFSISTAGYEESND